MDLLGELEDTSIYRQPTGHTPLPKCQERRRPSACAWPTTSKQGRFDWLMLGGSGYLCESGAFDTSPCLAWLRYQRDLI